MRILHRLAGLCVLASAASADVAAVAHPEEAFDAPSTVVWTPVFQAGWDALNAELGGKPEESGNPLAAKLDAFDWLPEAVMPADRWKVWSGPATADFFGRVNREAAEMLEVAEGPFTEVEGRPDGVAFYSLLDAEVAFWRPFYRSKKAALGFRDAEGGTTPVQCWGVRSEESADFNDSVRILGWRPGQGCHAVQLRCLGNAGDTVILFQPPAGQDFATACHWIRTWREAWRQVPEQAGEAGDRALHGNDVLRVPYLKLSAEADFVERLQGFRKYAGKPDRFVISAARQRIDFELHERGARVRAVAEGGIEPFGGPAPTFARDFSFERPFFVFLWRDRVEWPYFGLWVGDPSAMTAWAAP